MQGRIIKGVGGFYYVQVVGSGIYECRARGIFRKEKQKPLVGDQVTIEVLDETEKLGNVAAILPRKNELIRPASANIDQALVIFSMENPKPNLLLLDRFLVMMEQQHIDTVICFNKVEQAPMEELDLLRHIYSSCGYRVLLTSAVKQEGIQLVKQQLQGKTTVVAGPSGVGKSSLTNLLQDQIHMETGEISKKLKRGRHTTRHCQLIGLDESSFLMDTPGFSALRTDGMEKAELKHFFREFRRYEGKCRFQGCVHICEPDCAVTAAREAGLIYASRYRSYRELYEELKELEKRRY